MRFILNFIFFGILFYLIWMYFPDAFTTLVSWANHIIVFIKELSISVWDKIGHHVPEKAAPAASALLLFFTPRPQ